MKSFPILCCVIVIMVLGSLGCRKGVPATSLVGTIPTYANASKQEIRDAILQGGTLAGWQMREETEGRINAIYHIRTHSVAVNIIYDISEYRILYQNSVNLKARGETIHPNYNKWVNMLNRNIASALQQIRHK